jgi:hypothetical protein
MTGQKGQEKAKRQCRAAAPMACDFDLLSISK